MLTENEGDVVEAGEYRFPIVRVTTANRIDHSPSFRLQKNGEFHVNDAALGLIGRPQAVEFLYDPQRKAIGIRPADTKDQFSALRRRDKDRPHMHIFSGRAFTRFHGIDTSVARRYPVELVDGILVAELEAGSSGVTRRSTPEGAGVGESDAESS